MADPATGEALDALFGGGQPSHAAFVVPDDGQVLSYADTAERIETLAGRLAAAGVRRGDRVAVTLPNSPDFVQLMLAITLLGAAAAPLNPAYTEPEYTFYLEDVAPRLLLMPAAHPTSCATGSR
jgi:acyl-CoA synthetase (AMP-forming)/AMP-acid ligase II